MQPGAAGFAARRPGLVRWRRGWPAAAARIASAAAVSAAFLASAGARRRRRAALRASRPISRIKSLVSIASVRVRSLCVPRGFFPSRRSAGKGISSAPAQRHVVAMDQVVAAAKPRMAAISPVCLPMMRRRRPRIGDQAAADLAAVGGADDDGVAALEGALHPRDAGRQQALAGAAPSRRRRRSQPCPSARAARRSSACARSPDRRARRNQVHGRRRQSLATGAAPCRR